MSNKIKKVCDKYKSLLKISLIIFTLPFSLKLINLFTEVVFSLGLYTGTFIRFLYDIVTY